MPGCRGTNTRSRVRPNESEGGLRECGMRATVGSVRTAPFDRTLSVYTGGFKPTAKLESVLLITPGPEGKFEAARVDMKQVVDDGIPERVRLHPNDVVFVPRTWIADADVFVQQYVIGLVPAFPRVGVGASLNNL